MSLNIVPMRCALTIPPDAEAGFDLRPGLKGSPHGGARDARSRHTRFAGVTDTSLTSLTGH